MFKTRICGFLVCMAVLFSSLFSCQNASDSKTNSPSHQKTYYSFFDTESRIYSYGNDTKAEFEANASGIEALLTEYHRLMDIYFSYAGVNNLKTVNENAGVEPVKVDKKLVDFLKYCKEVYSITNGATNIAMGSVLSLWHECREEAKSSPESARIPDADELAEATKHTDINDLIIDEEACTVYIADPKMSLDVGAVGKGYATERAAQMLIEKGVSSYVLNIGGNIRMIGDNGGEPWTVGITNPDKTADSFAKTVYVKNTSLVTSGNYERFYTVGTESYHHIIDPKTNMPSVYFASVSVFTEDSGLADALSTALFCMSESDGRSLIDTIDGVDVIWITQSGTVTMTDGIAVKD